MSLNGDLDNQTSHWQKTANNWHKLMVLQSIQVANTNDFLWISKQGPSPESSLLEKESFQSVMLQLQKSYVNTGECKKKKNACNLATKCLPMNSTQCKVFAGVFIPRKFPRQCVPYQSPQQCRHIGPQHNTSCTKGKHFFHIAVAFTHCVLQHSWKKNWHEAWPYSPKKSFFMIKQNSMGKWSMLTYQIWQYGRTRSGSHFRPGTDCGGKGACTHSCQTVANISLVLVSLTSVQTIRYALVFASTSNKLKYDYTWILTGWVNSCTLESVAHIL